MTRRFLVRKEIDRARADPWAAHLYWEKWVWCNYHITKALVNTAVVVPTGWVALEDLIPKQREVAVDWVEPGTPGALQVVWGPREETLEFSFAALCELYEDLTVEYGIIRRLPFRIAEGRFYLYMSDDLQPSVPSLRSRELLEGWEWKSGNR